MHRDFLTIPDFTREELELFLVASRKQGIPLVIGSAGDTGTNSRVDRFVGTVLRKIASSGGET